MNVIDDYKQLTPERITALNQMQSFDAGVGMWNVYGNLNLGGIIRTANFLGFREVIYYGRRKWDKRGAVGTYHYTPTTFFDNEEDFLADIKTAGYNLVCLENNTDKPVESLTSFVWPKKPFILVGEEEDGLPDSILDQAYACVQIDGRGSVPSLNVSVAASIAMYDFVAKRD